MKTEIIEKKGRRFAVVPLKDFEQLKHDAEMLEDIQYDTVDFQPNYDEKYQEPRVLPGKFPNLLVNGSGGIAVGMATSIPPHNLGEVCDAIIAYIDNPLIELDEIMEFIPGPDFPTGATVCGRLGIKEAYLTGRGRIIVRAKYEIEELKDDHGEVVVTCEFCKTRYHYSATELDALYLGASDAA